MKISKGSVVAIDYTLSDDKGIQLDSSNGKDPLYYLQGYGNLIPGMEEGLEGKEKGEKLSLVIAPEKGYGERDDKMVQKVDKKELESVPNLQIGMQLQAETPQGVFPVTVVSIQDDHVLLDANHPLAGVTLHFDVEIMEVREATEEETQHGHAHGPNSPAH